METPQYNIPPEVLEQITKQVASQLTDTIRNQVLNDLKSEENRKKEEDRIRREQEHETINSYADTMKNSPDSWVDVRQIVDQGSGQAKIEMDWNDAFIKECRENGISGTTDEDVVRKYLAILTYNLDQQIAEELKTETNFE